jgi:hypothetical protein
LIPKGKTLVTKTSEWHLIYDYKKIIRRFEHAIQENHKTRSGRYSRGQVSQIAAFQFGYGVPASVAVNFHDPVEQ